MASFRALQLSKRDEAQEIGVVDFAEADLMDGDVTVRVAHSTVNYKDGLAITGKAPVVRRWPMIPGVDFAGTVETSHHPSFQPGDQVILNGWGLGETHLGSYADKARVKGDWLVRLPEGMSTFEAMAIGTAGYTAMLCVLALERHRIVPGLGPVVVTGAAGGVGSIATALLGRLGYHVIAVTGRTEEADYLTRLGASEILDRQELASPPRPLGKERWAGAVDAVGGVTLANVIAATKYGGAVTACGNAGGMDLTTSVAPFILRGVALLGIESARCPIPLREEAWGRLARDLDRSLLAELTSTIGFGEIVDAATAITEGKIRGRVVVDMAR
jgi:acrylyl-CoA reductase (NADPH)